MDEKLPQPSRPDAGDRQSAVRSNAAAVQQIVSAVEGTLGPKGLDCMLVDRFGDVTITNDGATILSKIDATHPASRLLIHSAAAQDEEVGDGTTTATVVAATLVEEGASHILRGVPAMKIIEGMRSGIAAALRRMAEAAITVDGIADPLVTSAAVIAARGDDGLAQLAAQAAETIPADKLLREPSFRLAKRVLAKVGAESRVFHGLVIDKERMNRQMPPELSGAPVLVVADALEPEKLDDEALATEVGFRRHTALREEFETSVRQLIDLGVKCVVVERRVDEIAEELLAEAGVMVLRRVSRRDLSEVAGHCGANPLMRSGLRRPPEELTRALGWAEHVAEDERLGHVRITGGRGHPTATILVGAATPEVKDERQRIAQDAAAAVQAVLRGGVLPGGGAAEIGAISAVTEAREGVAGLATYGVDAVMSALRRPLAQIVTNAGFNPLEKVEDVLAAQAATGNPALGVDCDGGAVTDMVEARVLDPAPVKIAALKTAAEIAEAILRINVVIRMKQKESSGPGQSSEQGTAPGAF